MRCPFCNFNDTQVKNSRPTEDNASIRRRRECPQCDGRFTTFERVKLGDITVIKRSGDAMPFEREKIAKSIYTAMRKRPFSREDIEKFISKIIQNLESQGDSSIPSRVIGEMVLNELAGLDPVAYVRFASVYKDFQDSEDFNHFIAHLAQKDKSRKE
jgi:transcriptional repressor NrdR